jgi:mycothiol synthase
VVERVDRLDAGTVDEVLALATAAAEADGVYPLDEGVVLRLRHQRDLPAVHQPAVHLLARAGDGRLAGYAQVHGGTAELVVHPDARRRGVGRALVTGAVSVAGRGLHLWAHGDHPGAAALAGSLGWDRIRVLWRLRRPLAEPVLAPALPEGVTLRTFRPGADDQAWLAVNARAFAGHPEQGRWTIDDLRLRQAEPWFDPAGFLLAVRAHDDRLLGFHWTKVHGGPERIGEVYVLGVDPAAHGTGLGTALTLAGLRHLQGRGLTAVMLYVDESNQPAMALYTRLGFARWSADVMYASPPVTDGMRL